MEAGVAWGRADLLPWSACPARDSYTVVVFVTSVTHSWVAGRNLMAERVLQTVVEGEIVQVGKPTFTLPDTTTAKHCGDHGTRRRPRAATRHTALCMVLHRRSRSGSTASRSSSEQDVPNPRCQRNENPKLKICTRAAQTPSAGPYNT